MLYNEDCLEILKTIDSESVDLVVTDCPYRIQGGGCTNAEEKGWIPIKDDKGNKFYSDSKHISLCGVLNDADKTTYLKGGKLFKHNDIQFKEWLPEVYRVLKPGTHCYIMINPRNLKDLWQDAEDAGFVFQNLLVWDKGNVTPNKYYLNSYELILMLRKGKAKNINNLGSKNILRVPNIIGCKLHPTEKPCELMKILVENSSEVDQVVLDPFMGVGGVGMACKLTKRRFIGIEIDERYFTIAKDRMAKIGEIKSEKPENYQYSLF